MPPIKKRKPTPQPPADLKRIAPRIVSLKSLQGYALGPGTGTGSFRAHLINVSATGAQIYSSKPMDQNTKIALELESSDGNKSLTYMGQIVWVRKNAMKAMGRYSYGVSFQNLSAEHQDFLNDHYAAHQ